MPGSSDGRNDNDEWAAFLRPLPPLVGGTATSGPAAGVQGLVAGRIAPDAAVRARLNAAAIDALVIGLITGALVGIMGLSTTRGGAVLFPLAVQFLYFFALELRSGQTLGKRAMRIRVVALDGSPATMRMCAIRNALRIFDALPLLYASGLLSMMRTGRTRRQRNGDVAAGTTVILERGGKALPTPRWLLPTVTVLVTALSVSVLVTALHHRGQPGGPPELVATGWPGDNSLPPAAGPWQAVGTTTSSEGYGYDPVGGQLQRRWQISKTCQASSCAFLLTRQVAGGPSQTAQLIPRPDGWHATFPDQTYVCASGPAGVTYWRQHSTWVLRFLDHGARAEAHERNVSFAPACGWGTNTHDWVATHR